MDERMQAVEKKDRFLERRDRIIARFGADHREAFRKRLREAEFAILALDADRGMRALEELYRLDRGNVELGFYLGETFFSAGDLKRASGFFKRVLAVDANHFESLVYSGIAASEAGETATAESFLKRAIDRKPEGFLPHFALGALYAHGSRWSEAERPCPGLSSSRRSLPRTSCSGPSCGRRGRSGARSPNSSRPSRWSPTRRTPCFSSVCATSRRTRPSGPSTASSRLSRRTRSDSSSRRPFGCSSAAAATRCPEWTGRERKRTGRRRRRPREVHPAGLTAST